MLKLSRGSRGLGLVDMAPTWMDSRLSLAALVGCHWWWGIGLEHADVIIRGPVLLLLK